MYKRADCMYDLQPGYLGRRGTTAHHREVPVLGFCLTRLSVRAPTTLRDVGPQIILCTSGHVTVDELDVSPGHAARWDGEHDGRRWTRVRGRRRLTRVATTFARLRHDRIHVSAVDAH